MGKMIIGLSPEQMKEAKAKVLTMMRVPKLREKYSNLDNKDINDKSREIL